MKDFRELIFVVAKSAATRTFTILNTDKVTNPNSIAARLSAQPDDAESKKAVEEALEVYKDSWAICVKAGFQMLPEALGDLLIKETRLVTTLLLAKNSDEAGSVSLALGMHAEVAPLLRDVFPLSAEPPDLPIIYQTESVTSWSKEALKLFWMTTPGNHCNWFVAAPDAVHAEKFANAAIRTGNYDGEVAATLIGNLSLSVSRRCHDGLTGWGSMEAVWDVGGHINTASPPRIVTIAGTQYREGPGLLEMFNKFMDTRTAATETLQNFNPSKESMN